jgi:hypothetical protein
MIKPELEKEFQGWVDVNTDPYSKTCVDVTREIMLLIGKNEPMQEPYHLINVAVKNLELGDITGFMAGVVSSAVSYFDIRGEEFRLKHLALLTMEM